MWPIDEIYYSGGDNGIATPSQSYMTADLKSKIVQGDYQALAKARSQNLADLEPNLTTIKNSTDGKHGYVEVINESNGQHYQMVPSNHGWIWHYTTSMTTATKENGQPQKICVVQTGTYSASSQIMGLSYQTIENLPTDITALVLSTMVSWIVGGFIKKLVTGAIYKVALNAAVEAAAAEAVEGGLMLSAVAGTIASAVLATIGAGVVGALVAVAIYYISDFLHRSYGLTINVYNWDSVADWEVADLHTDNAVKAEGETPWAPQKLVKVTSTPLLSLASLTPADSESADSVPGPNGNIPAANPVAQFASYGYQNGEYSSVLLSSIPGFVLLLDREGRHLSSEKLGRVQVRFLYLNVGF
jgi:hypothetical protein